MHYSASACALETCRTWLTVNSDGAVKANLGVATCGGVLRDANMLWLGGFAKRLHVTSAYLAEL